MRFTIVQSAASVTRLEAARAALRAVAPGAAAVIIGASRAVADELAVSVARTTGGLFGVTRVGFLELATRLALPALASDGLSPTGALGHEAIAARAAFEAAKSDGLTYFTPVAQLPGFAKALSRTISELRLAGTTAEQLAELDDAGRDLAQLMTRVDAQATHTGIADRALLFHTAARALERGPGILGGSTVVLLDVAIANEAERQFVGALTKAAASLLATVPEGDTRTYDALVEAGGATAAESGAEATPLLPTALTRLQQRLFAQDSPPGEAASDASVRIFSAPGEGRECVEIARRVMEEAGRGVPFDEMAVLLRAPHTYLGLLEHAFTRAGVPAWFDRGTRRPDPSGRAFLALLACADEKLSARRFAEYLSLGQVPPDRSVPDDTWTTPNDESTESLVPEGERTEDTRPEEEAALADREGDRGRTVAGTLRAPWKWEELIVESAVIGGRDRWNRRLGGLQAEYRRKVEELQSEEHPDESPRISAIQRDIAHLDHLREFALPIIGDMDEWPLEAKWGEWLDLLQHLAPRVLRQPARVQRVLQELGPLADIGPVRLGEVRDVLTGRLLTLMHESPRRRQGSVFVGIPQSARGRSFRVVFVPGLAERVFPQRLREDALLLDERRVKLGPTLAVQKQRADEERVQLRLAIGAASERVYLSWPRLELQESRPRVPSFYVLDIARAVEGHIPRYATLRDRAFAEGGATLSWPAPADPNRAIDEFEHDLAMLYQLLRETNRTAAKGRARYLYELSPHLRRSLTGRWARWQNRWHAADGIITTTTRTLPALTAQRLGNRPYSLSALQRFAECPYQFQLSAIYQLSPLEEPTPLQRMDPLTRGGLFHSIQAEFFRQLESNGLLPVTERRLEAARKMLEWAIAEVSKTAYDELAPAIDRVWQDELASIARDLRGWLVQLVEDGKEWRPDRFEFGFGLPGDRDRDPRSVSEPARVDGRFLIRGSIDLVERRLDGSALRVTDHKTGKNRTTLATIVGGGRVLQPVLYGLSLEAITGETVEEGRLSFCTAAGGFAVRQIPLNELSRRRALEVLEIIDRAVERGTLAARPGDGACTRCDFIPVCGSDEERRTRRKVATLFADLDELRRLP